MSDIDKHCCVCGGPTTDQCLREGESGYVVHPECLKRWPHTAHKFLPMEDSEKTETIEDKLDRIISLLEK